MEIMMVTCIQHFKDYEAFSYLIAHQIEWHSITGSIFPGRAVETPNVSGRVRTRTRSLAPGFQRMFCFTMPPLDNVQTTGLCLLSPLSQPVLNGLYSCPQPRLLWTPMVPP